MSFDEHIQVRVVALFLNTLVAWPFGLWRNFIVRSTGLSHDSSGVKTYLVDTLIFLSFQMPLYVGNLILGGADLIEIIKATVTVSLIAGTLGRPYGIYLDWLKVRHGLKHTLDANLATPQTDESAIRSGNISDDSDKENNANINPLKV